MAGYLLWVMPMSLLGTTIGRIRLVDRLGEGGMGEVFAGYDETLDRRVAVKCVRVGDRPEKIKGRFLQEARILSRLDHPNICQIYDFVESEDRDFLVMELVEGQSLRQVAEAGLDEKRKLEIAQDVANVLVAAHAEGVVHRDLKPDHVMITPEGEVKVLDFGVAHSIDVDRDATLDFSGDRPADAPAPPAYRTVAGSVIGTPSYMSPEQARGEPVTPASDMYTLGLLLQELFTGERPYDRQPLAKLLVEVAKGCSRPVTGLGRALSELIEGLKELRPSLRPTAKETADRIRWIRETPVRWLRRAVAAAAVLVLAAGVTKYTVDLERERSAAVAAREQAEDLVAFMLEDLSGALRPEGKLEVLEQVAGKALEYYERAGPGGGGDSAFRRGNAYAIVGDVLNDQGDRASALEAASTALEIHRGLAEASPERLDWQNQLALDQMRLGDVLSLSGEDRRAEARQTLESAFATASRLVELDPGRVEWRQTLAETQYTLGIFHLFSAGDAERARQAFSAAIDGYRRLAAEDPSSLHFQYRLAVLLGQGLGQAYDELGREAEALAAIEKAYALYEELTRADPSNHRWQYGFSWENRRLGAHLESQGRELEALARYRDARAISERLLELEPNRVDWQHGLATDHSAIAAICDQLGDPAAALAAYGAATVILERLLTVDPADDELRRWLAFDYAAGGGVLRQLGRSSEAEGSWRRAAELLSADAREPAGVESEVLETHAVALLSLGRVEEARPVVEKLRARGWLEGSAGAELVELCRRYGLD